MIKAVAKVRGRDTVILGLSAENTRRLLDDKPILIDLQEIDPRLPDLTILLCGGKTEDGIRGQLGEYFRMPGEQP